MLDLPIELIVDRVDPHTVRCRRLARRKDKLREDEAKLRKSLKDYDKYLRENDLRRKRAQKKHRDESITCHEREEDLVRLREANIAAREEREAQRAQIKTAEAYEAFLKRVLSHEHDYDEIGELLDRHATLKGTNEELIRQKELNQQRLETLQRDALRSREEHKVEMLRLNNKLATLESRREAAQTERLHWENEATQAEREACENTLLLGRLKMASANLYALIQARQGKSKEKMASTDKQLDKIRTYIQDLASICDEYDKGRSWITDH